ncbi:MAG: hypothetical protein HQL27_05205, partial [Candidatus Omnitrophica bacterium]|nr:hypothetical protein [Candidatus Omnitrophota bacterium]
TMAVVSNNAQYTIQQGADTYIITVNRGDEVITTDDQTIVQKAGFPPTTYDGLPDGIENSGTILFVDGRIDSLGGTVQNKTNLTISSESDMVIQSHLYYENYTPEAGIPGETGYVPPTAEGTDNMLGLVAWSGNVRIGTSAPNNINIHATVLSSNGIFSVDNHEDQGRGPRGTATLLGGATTNQYGAFGLFNGLTGQQLSGYGRNFNYDQRMLIGNSPPYFPTLNTFIAYTGDITDKLVWQEGS